jgi:O-antigen ligase
MLVFSGSRSNLIGFFCAGVILFLLRLKLKPLHFLYIILLFAGTVILILFSPLSHIITETISSHETGTLDVSSLGRLLIWKGAAAHFLNAPLIEKLFGIGLANFSTLDFPFFIIAAKHASGAHNNFLQALIETGVCGLILFLTFFVAVLVRLYRQSKNDRLAMIYFLITLSLLFSGMTQETFWFQPVFGLLWLYYMSLLAVVLDNYPSKRAYE